MSTTEQPVNGTQISNSMLPSWFGFTSDERRRMIDDDLTAGTSVSLVLTAIVFLGMVIGIVGVLLSLKY